MATVSTEQLQWLLADVDTAHRAATSSNESQIWQRISIALNNLSEGHYAARALLQQLPSDATKSGGLGVVSQHRGSNNPISPRETGRSLQRHNTSHFEPLSPRRSFAPGTIKVPSVFAEYVFILSLFSVVILRHVSPGFPLFPQRLVLIFSHGFLI